ncbi:tyrosine-type recombinase/integrase [Halovivax cerinus]|uniref:Tyrosine-type recombinase/integrase n=1 Tax=Halovivax cerinus TaxID=1487865 RepID=A0ABD5NQF8_9EURY|nr:tyrosine-type recombinase/integrase [Halovivax cerinus]
MTSDLEPLDPRTARQMYLDARAHELADATIQSQGYRLKQFVEWCEEEGIENMNNFSGRDIHQFRIKRREEDDVATATMKGQLATLRAFLRFAASIDAVESGLDEQIILPKTTEDDAREVMLDPDLAKKMLDHLEQYRYAALEHALLAILWHTGLRIGAAVGLDIEDYNPDDQYLALVHRPDSGSTLKNGKDGERLVAVTDSVCAILDDWLEVNHPGVTDQAGRNPLFATRRDRLSRNRGRTIAYQFTRPCVYGDPCPHDRDPDECEAIPTSQCHACPSSLSPHPIRRGSITYHLQQETPKPIVSDRMDVSPDVLDRHYDQRTSLEKMRQRRRYLPDD